MNRIILFVIILLLVGVAFIGWTHVSDKSVPENSFEADNNTPSDVDNTPEPDETEDSADLETPPPPPSG